MLRVRSCRLYRYTRDSNDWYKVDRQLLKCRNYRRSPVGLISQVKLSLVLLRYKFIIDTLKILTIWQITGRDIGIRRLRPKLGRPDATNWGFYL